MYNEIVLPIGFKIKYDQYSQLYVNSEDERWNDSAKSWRAGKR